MADATPAPSPSPAPVAIVVPRVGPGGRIDPEFWVTEARRRQPGTPEVTDWFSGNIAPARHGWYDRLFTDGVYRQHWDGAIWRAREGGDPHWRQVHDYPAWRGLAAPAPGEAE